MSELTERVGEGGWEVPTRLAQESWTLILKHGFRRPEVEADLEEWVRR